MTKRRLRRAALLALAMASLLPVNACKRPGGPAPAAPRTLPDGSTLLFDAHSLAGWKVLTEDFFDAAGKVYVHDGTLVLEEGQALTGVSWRGSELPRTNYEVRLEAMRLAGSDFFCGMTFPVGQAFCTLILGGWGGQVVGLSNVNDLAAHENDTTRMIEFQSNRWYRIALRVTAEKVRVWLDDEEIISQPTKGKRFTIWPQQEPVRPFGLASYSTKAAYRNIRVRQLPPNTTAPPAD